MITIIYWLNKTNLKIKYLSSFNYLMAFSETRIVIGGLAHVPVLIFIANFIDGKFRIKTQEAKDNRVIKEPVKIIKGKIRYLMKKKQKL